MSCYTGPSAVLIVCRKTKKPKTSTQKKQLHKDSTKKHSQSIKITVCPSILLQSITNSSCMMFSLHVPLDLSPFQMKNTAQIVWLPAWNSRKLYIDSRESIKNKESIKVAAQPTAGIWANLQSTSSNWGFAKFAMKSRVCVFPGVTCAPLLVPCIK